MKPITRRSAAGLLAAVPLAAACGKQDEAGKPVATAGADQAAGPPAAPAAPVFTGPMDEELEAMVLEFESNDNWAEPGLKAAPADVNLDRLQRAAAISQVREDIGKRKAAGQTPYFYWPTDDTASIDYHHIALMGPTLPAAKGPATTAFSDAEFELTHEVLQRMANANYFNLVQDAGVAAADQRVIFALRGSRPVQVSTGMTKSVRLHEAIPDHRSYNCTIGVWNRNDKTVAAFEGSTVPSELHLAIYQQWLNMPKKPAGSWETCMLPQGLHRRRVGTFRETAAPDKQLPLTLKQWEQSPTPVLRSLKTGDSLTVDCTWDPGGRGGAVASVGAHIHAALLNPASLVKFSSQGCMTISGLYSGGQIRDFTRLMGLKTPVLDAKGTYRSASDNYSFPVMLLSGREARLHAAGADLTSLRRVRIGSSAPANAPTHIVRQVLARVGATPPPESQAAVFDPASMLKLIKVQEQSSGITGVKRDGIVGPVAAKGLGQLSFDT